MRVKILKDTTASGLEEKVNQEINGYGSEIRIQYNMDTHPVIKGEKVVKYETVYTAIVLLPEEVKSKFDVYATPGLDANEELFKRIESALGFRLFFWQKTYITRGVFRMTGKTTAYILRQLLQVNDTPMDLSSIKEAGRYAEDVSSHHMVDYYKWEVKKIKDQLDLAGIPTRIVFFTDTEKREHYRKHCEKGDGLEWHQKF